MPWDGTELRVARPRRRRRGRAAADVLGGDRPSRCCSPSGPGRLAVRDRDRSGWWNLYRVAARRRRRPAAAPARGSSPVRCGLSAAAGAAVLADGRLLRRTSAPTRWACSTRPPARSTDVDLPCTDLVGLGRSATGDRAAGRGRRARCRAALRRARRSRAATSRDVRRRVDEPADPAYLPEARPMTCRARAAGSCTPIVYPPRNPDFTAPDGRAAAVPGVRARRPDRAASPAVADAAVAYFTSRGIGVVDVNYGGSTGYGRAYRERLRGQWGVVDVEDCVAAVQGLVDAGQADGDRLAIRGGSAGGWTVLAALTTHRRLRLRRLLLRRRRAGAVRRGHARLRVALHRRAGRAAARGAGRCTSSGRRSPRRRAVLPGAAVAGRRGQGRAAVAGRDVPRRARRQGHPARVPRYAGEGHGFRERRR